MCILCHSTFFLYYFFSLFSFFSFLFFFFFFFLMIRRPPRSTLFPYTDALPISKACSDFDHSKRQPSRDGCNVRRSEEHTSELQSPDHLVCRLLLEKKKKKQKKIHNDKSNNQKKTKKKTHAT